MNLTMTPTFDGFLVIALINMNGCLPLQQDPRAGNCKGDEKE